MRNFDTTFQSTKKKESKVEKKNNNGIENNNELSKPQLKNKFLKDKNSRIKLENKTLQNKYRDRRAHASDRTAKVTQKKKRKT